MARIILTVPDGTQARVIHDDGEFCGPFPPLSSEFKAICDRLMEQGIVPEPCVGPAQPDPIVVDALAFRRLFTEAERRAITAAARSDDTVRMFMDDAAAAAMLQLDHPDVTQGLDYLVASGIITRARADTIKAGEGPS
jgi:hypothetical protein